MAGYLAKAGLDVCVIEQQDKVGGGVVTREVTAPGFKQDICSTQHASIQANPLIHQDELGLKSKYGLQYILPDIQYTFLFSDDSFPGMEDCRNWRWPDGSHRSG